MSKTNNADDAKLAELAKRIAAGHKQVVKGYRTSLEHAKSTGELLQQARDLAPRGTWSNWVKKNCDFDLRVAQTYMRIAEHYPEVEAVLADGKSLNIANALRLIGQPKPATDGPSATPPAAAFILSREEYTLKRKEAERVQDERKIRVEADESAAKFLKGRVASEVAAVRKFAAKAKLAGLDVAQVAIVLIDALRHELTADKVFTPPAVEPAPSATNGPGGNKGDNVPAAPSEPVVNRVKEHMNGTPKVAAA